MSARPRLFLVALVVGALLPSEHRPEFAPIMAFSRQLPSEPKIADTWGASCKVRYVSFAVNGSPAPLISARRGDTVTVTFEVPPGCSNRLTFASFVAPAPAFDGSRLEQQARFSEQSATFGAGRHALTVDVFGFPGAVNGCDSTRDPGAPTIAPDVELREAVRANTLTSREQRDQLIAEVRQVRATRRLRAERRANEGGPYDSTCDGSPSQNGNGGGGAGGRPCAGCVGNADDKNPPGQLPGGNDHNAGYECDRNNGVGQSNPAHSGCENFQIDFSYNSVVRAPKRQPSHERQLIAGVFCLSTTSICYSTDNTFSGTVIGA